MNNSKQQEREAHILKTATDLIIRQGYDKTTMGDIAEAAGLGRGLVYLHYANKEKLFEALLYQETILYTRVWLERQEADPNSGTIAAMYRNALYAINSRPLMAAVMRRDRNVFGNYLRRPNNRLQANQSKSLWTETIHKLQDVGAIRQDISPQTLAAILDMLAYGLISMEQIRSADETPPFDETMEAIALLLDQALMPNVDIDMKASKQIIQDFATTALHALEQKAVDSIPDKKEQT